MNSFHRLTSIFSDFPGIGPRQAKRFVYFLLSRNKEYLHEFKKLLEELQDEIRICSLCFRYFPKNTKSSSLCPICSNKDRSRTKLLIVARDVDLENIEKTSVYEGLYFVLGGTVPILEKEPEKRVRIAELKKRMESEKEMEEVIIAMNANPEGENTEEYIRKELRKKTNEKHIKVSTLGRGLSTGVELEYSDSDTLKSAFSNRKQDKPETHFHS